MPSIQERTLKNGEKRYRVQFRTPGRKSPNTETFTTKREAQNFLELMEQIGPEKAVQARDYLDENPDATLNSLKPLLDNYLTHCASYATPGTVDEYRKLAHRTWLKYFTTQPAETITPEDITAWVAWQRQQITIRNRPYSAKSIANAHGLLSSVLQHAVKQDKLPKNVAKGTRLPKDTITDKDRYITPDQYTRLIGCITNDNARLLVTFLYATGCRWGEATALTIKDLDLDSYPATASINKAWKQGEKDTRYLGAPKTARSIRRISLSNTLVNQLREHITEHKKKPGDLLFSTRAGKPIKYHMFSRTFWKPALKQAQLPHDTGLHQLRHGYASAMIQAGEILPVIQQQLGHESIKTTVDRYGHLSPQSMIGAAERMDSILSPAYPQIEG